MNLEVDPVGFLILAWIAAPVIGAVALYWIIRLSVRAALADARAGSAPEAADPR